LHTKFFLTKKVKMKTTYIQNLTLLVAVVFCSVYLSGCMMAGMGMMHGDNSHGMNMEDHNSNRVIIKEFNTGEYKITAEFPSSIHGKADVCRIKILNKAANTLQTDVEIYLEVLHANTNGHEDHTIKIKHSKYENGYFVFLPNVSSNDSYNLAFAIERIKTNIFSDPIRIEYSTENNSEMGDSHSHSDSESIFSSPVLYIGAVAMAVMMIFMLR